MDFLIPVSHWLKPSPLNDRNSPKYACNRKNQLRNLADTVPNHAWCDLAKEHLDAFNGSLGDFGANHSQRPHSSRY